MVAKIDLFDFVLEKFEDFEEHRNSVNITIEQIKSLIEEYDLETANFDDEFLIVCYKNWVLKLALSNIEDVSYFSEIISFPDLEYEVNINMEIWYYTPVKTKQECLSSEEFFEYTAHQEEVENLFADFLYQEEDEDNSENIMIVMTIINFINFVDIMEE